MGSPVSGADYAAGMSADELFLKTVSAIEKRLQLIGRLPAVRIKSWLNKLKQSTSNLTWKRNRNLYARLLLEQLRAGCLEVPFNALPPEGPLPTLPTYLTYRFISPPRQRASYGSGSDDYSTMSQLHPHSAGSAAAAGHSSWSVMRASAPMPLLNQNSSGISSPAGVLQPGQLSALSPIRCGQQPRGGADGLVRQSWPDESEIGSGGIGSSKRVTNQRASPVRAYGSSCSPSGVNAAAARGIGSPVRMRPGGAALPGAVLRPGSPGAAGLLDAAVAIAAELEGGKVDAEMLDCRLRYAEDKLLQQEAELVRLQGQAAAARRRVKAVTAATLGELVERYGSAAASWDSTTTQRPGSSSRQPTYAQSVYGPMWQLISSIQEVLNCCDQQDMQWQQEKLGAAAAAAARFDADQQAQQEEVEQQQAAAAVAAAAAAANKGMGIKQGSGNKNSNPVHDAASLEQQVMLKLKELVVQLQKRSEQLAGLLQSSKDAATAAAAGSGVSAAEVAAAAAESMRPMLKLIKHMAAKDNVNLQKQLEAAANAAALATQSAAPSKQRTGSKHDSGSSSSDGSSGVSDHNSSDSEDASNDHSSSGSDSSSAHKRRKSRRHRKQAQKQRQLQEQHAQSARIGRLQAAYQLFQELEDATNKLSGQLQEGKRRLADAGNYSRSSSPVGIASMCVMGAHEHGLAAAAVAGITASLAAATSAYSVRARELKQQLKAISKATAAAATTAAAPDSSKRLNVWKQQPAVGAVGDRSASFGHSDSLAATRLGARIGDSTLAGTFGASSPRASTQFNSISHYLIGGAAAASSPASSIPSVAAGTTLGSKSAFTSSLLAASSPGTATSLLSRSSTPTATAAAGGADAVHQHLANLPRQASRVSERASVLLSGSTTPEPGGTSSSSLLGRAASPSLGATNITSAGGMLGGARNSLLSGAGSSSFTGAGAGFGSSLLSGSSAPGAAAKLSSSKSLLGASDLGASGGSLLSGGIGGVRSSPPSLLAGGGSLLAGGGNSSLAAMSSRLNTLSQRWGATGSNSFRL